MLEHPLGPISMGKILDIIVECDRQFEEHLRRTHESCGLLAVWGNGRLSREEMAALETLERMLARRLEPGQPGPNRN